MDSTQGDSAPWGHKITVHIYLPGTIRECESAANRIADTLIDLLPNADHIGEEISVVQDKPWDQVAS